jgi:hypothetical protein
MSDLSDVRKEIILITGQPGVGTAIRAGSVVTVDGGLLLN